jgi:hypothetical protein
VIAGLVAAAAMLGHLIRSLLFGISSSDPLTIAAVYNRNVYCSFSEPLSKLGM